MKNERSPSSEQQEPLDVSAYRSARALRLKLWAELFKTTALALVALCVIVLGSVAWFVSNSKVDSGGITISHQYDTIRLATKGNRQEAEIRLLGLDEGTLYPPDSEPPEAYYYTEQGEIALRLSNNEVAVSPGASGEITFYIIPKRTETQTVNLHLTLAGCEEIETQGDSSTGRKLNDKVLSSLLSGHILLFQKCVDGKYSEWLSGSVPEEGAGGANYQITVTNENAQEGQPWPVTVYWVWPLRYENMEKDYQGQLDDFIEEQAIINEKNTASGNYYYTQIFLTKDKNMTTDEARSDAYNQADEYIGRKANYLYVTIQTDLVN